MACSNSDIIRKVWASSSIDINFTRLVKRDHVSRPDVSRHFRLSTPCLATLSHLIIPLFHQIWESITLRVFTFSKLLRKSGFTRFESFSVLDIISMWFHWSQCSPQPVLPYYSCWSLPSNFAVRETKTQRNGKLITLFVAWLYLVKLLIKNVSYWKSLSINKW